MSFSNDLDQEIVQEISEEYQKAAFWLPFSAIEIKKVFSETQLDELAAFISEIQAAGKSNKKKAEAIEKYSDAALKLLKMTKVIV
ncbi:hypothetical protein [Marinobacter xiaoshiensis]|uniref:Uncharacterized protein n=1 Tax=Marinobacter xiaoshiensis TaxID=3073652 RepID=A0ABU2HG82_9GAMM|nr:hypothetical protein [Marinobacter sp. F60267]MDS1310087.1 hypothetical protein [Marinobacter sp. F60267]